ncbi:arylsulfatase [Pedobacter sp. BS3]|uniref:sulfatase family protein n=1 Tax=Pedobacter sp. BS3 TaxID=2567937 RepID=UPI0011EE5502|nr:arylsulfatase [Pedobacter sp. BS3]TZF82615.1 arylsulfatase [Pedobacter sp. BS3]
MRKKYCVLAILGIISCTVNNTACYGQVEKKSPNIVFILADDLGIGDVKCFNPEGKISTPNIDKLASEGMKFTDAHASSSVCTPSRYSILTGRYPWRSRLQDGVLGGFSKPLIDSGRLTVASMLKEHGYHTAIIGKWHLGMDWPLKEGETGIKTGREVDYSKSIGNGPTQRGFDYYFGISASLDMEPFVFIENDRTLGVPSVEKTFMRKGLAAPDFEAEDVVPTLTRKAQETIKNAASASKPFFVYVTLPSPHTPVVPNKQFQGKSGVTAYGDYVMETDWAVGQVIQTLDSLGLRDNTIVFFSSDNGFAPYVLNEYNVEKLGHYPSYIYRGYKSDIWDGGHRIPLIARWPKQIQANTTCTDLVSLTDFMATCADLIQKKLPDSVAEDSYSLLPDLTGKAKQPVRPAIMYQSIDGNFAIQQGKWKLELCPGSGGWAAPRNKQAYKEGLPVIQLYDMQTDPSEKTNVQAQHPDIVKNLTELLEQYVRQGRSTPGRPLKNTMRVNILKKNKYMNNL